MGARSVALSALALSVLHVSRASCGQLLQSVSQGVEAWHQGLTELAHVGLMKAHGFEESEK